MESHHMKEIWKPIPGMESIYEASSLGKIRSLSRQIRSSYGASRMIKGRVLVPILSGHRYQRVTIAIQGVHRGHRVHRLVAEAFIPNPEALPEVNHKNGDKLDNRATNLEWCTRSSNNNHAIKMGLKPPVLGSQHGQSKLGERDVIAIRSAIEAGEIGYVLAEKYGVSRSTISNIKLRHTWTHI